MWSIMGMGRRADGELCVLASLLGPVRLDPNDTIHDNKALGSSSLAFARLSIQLPRFHRTVFHPAVIVSSTQSSTSCAVLRPSYLQHSLFHVIPRVR